MTKSRRMRWTGHTAPWKGEKQIYLEGKAVGKGPRRRWWNNIKTDFQEIDSEDADWIHLAQDKDPHSLMELSPS
jgi:hypothetical protein